VHEGPQRIAQPFYPGGQSLEPLRAGMFLSNEPGYYKAGEYGIRIENLVLIVEAGFPAPSSRCSASRRSPSRRSSDADRAFAVNLKGTSVG
jgi:Xaa-Pro aminopeptidase